MPEINNSKGNQSENETLLTGTCKEIKGESQ